MSDTLLIYATAKGWLVWVPDRWRMPLMRRCLRAIMRLQGVPVSEFSDRALDGGIRRLASLTDSRDLAVAASLRNLIRESEKDEGPQP